MRRTYGFGGGGAIAIGLINAQDAKASCKAASTGNLTLSGAQTVDGVSLVADDRCLVKDQSTGSQNGIYLVKAGAWVRSADADISAEVTPGVSVFVEQGTTNASSTWVLTTAAPITLGTTALTFTKVSGTGQITAGTGLTKTGDTINAIANADGSLIANADDLQVGILATDAQHGNRGGGALHAAATGSVDGFMAAADKTKLDAIEASAINAQAGAGLTRSGSTLNVVANADGSITVNADDVQVAFTSNAPTTIQPDDAAAAGTATKAAREDHKHAIVAATAGAIAIGDAAAEGSSTSFARADHVHSVASPAAPADVTKATASAGAATTFARADHKHDVSTAAPANVGLTNTEGTATSLARSDHVHAVPFYGIFGNGEDGNVTISSNQTLTKDMFYDQLTVNAGWTLNPGGYRIFCKTSCTINSTGKIARNGNNGAVPTAGAALAAGSIGSSGAGGAGGNFGNGGAGSGMNPSLGGNGGQGAAGEFGSTAGAGGTATAPTAANGGLKALPWAAMGHYLGGGSTAMIVGGAGGGGGGGDGPADSQAGGGGGSGGGVVVLCAKSLVLNGTVEAKGGNGGTGEASAGSGGGGGGGVIFAIYASKSGSGSFSVAGGAAGTGGEPGSTAGSAGTLIELQACA